MSGRHLAFPFHIGNDGRTASPSDISEHVKGEIVQLLLTNAAERPFLPDFGGGLRRMVFEGNSDYTIAVAKATITKSISYWLKERVSLLELEVEAQDAILTIGLRYRVIESGEEQLLRFEHNK